MPDLDFSRPLDEEVDYDGDEDPVFPKLTFQVIRRTIATLGQHKGSVKDIQGILRQSRAQTAPDIYMQIIPETVRT